LVLGIDDDGIKADTRRGRRILFEFDHRLFERRIRPVFIAVRAGRPERRASGLLRDEHDDLRHVAAGRRFLPRAECQPRHSNPSVVDFNLI
jgi:hypothetical protein